MSQFFINANAGPTPPIETIQGDTGSVTGSTIQIFGHSGNAQNAGATVSFVASSPTELDLAFSDNFNNTFLGTLAGNQTRTGASNTAVGGVSQNSITSGNDNTSLGSAALQNITSGSFNTAIGQTALQVISTQSENTAVGDASLAACSGANNTALGSSAGEFLRGGSNNLLLGVNAGIDYVGSESSNILLGHLGIVAESNVIRIGTQGVSIGQQNQSFIAGVFNTTSGRVLKTTVPGAYPYTMLLTDDVIFVNTSSTANTINLIAAPVIGTRVIIKDISANAALNNITVSGNGSNIIGTTSAATYVISSNGGSIELIYSGTVWGII